MKNKILQYTSNALYITSAIGLIFGHLDYAIYLVLSAMYLDNQIVFDE